MDLKKINRNKIISIILITILSLLVLQAVYQNFTTSRLSKDATHFAWHPTEDQFASFNDQDGILQFSYWDGENYKIKSAIQNDKLNNGGVQAFSWHPSGEFIAIANLFDGLYVYNAGGKLLQFIEYESIYTFAWNPSGTEIAVMIDEDNTEVRISPVNTDLNTPIIYNQYQIIEINQPRGSIGNFINWISDDILIIATSGTSNSDDGRIESVYLDGSGPMLNITTGQIFDSQLNHDLNRGLFLYTVENGSEVIGDTIHFYDYYEHRIIDLSTFNTIQTFTTTDYGVTNIDPISKNLVSLYCNVSNTDNCQVLVRNISSLVVIQSFEFVDSYAGQLFWHPNKNTLARIARSRIQIISTITFELTQLLK